MGGRKVRASRLTRTKGERVLDQMGVHVPVDGWERDSACRRVDPTLFFGPNRFEPKRERLARESAAKAVCATCPVLVPCREHALATGELYGVWGGLGEADRRAMLADTGHRRVAAEAV